MRFKLFVAIRNPFNFYDWEIAHAIIDNHDTEIIAALKAGDDSKVIELLGWGDDECELVDANELGRWLTEAWLDAERATNADEMYHLVCKAREYETSLSYRS